MHKEPRRSFGFTIIELTMTMILIGILAAVAIPKMNSGNLPAVALRDGTAAAIRHAQKTAVSHRRQTCVEFTDRSVSLHIDHDRSGSCDNHPLPLPGASTNTLSSQDPGSARFSPIPSTIAFAPDGTSSDASVVVLDRTPIVVNGATGLIQ